MAQLELDSVSMAYGPTQVLTDISLRVEDGAFYAMVGPSGSGKTTILRILGGFLQPTAGRVLLGGQDVTEVAPERRGLGMMFQSYALFPHMTVSQNVAFGLRMRRVAAQERGQRVAETLDLVGLPELGDRYPDQLSGGQQQRVALARALVTEPSALLLDEPLSALDRKIRHEMQFELRRIQRQTGVTAIIVTHDQEEALSLGDRLMVLGDGRVRQEGEPWEVYSHPISGSVASFLGSANLLSGSIDDVEQGTVTLADQTVWGVRLPPSVTAGDAVDVCVRPERWKVVEQRDPAAEAAAFQLHAVFTDVQLTGQIAVCTVETPAGDLEVTVLSTQGGSVRAGDERLLLLETDDLHVMPREVVTATSAAPNEAVG